MKILKFTFVITFCLVSFCLVAQDDGTTKTENVFKTEFSKTVSAYMSEIQAIADEALEDKMYQRAKLIYKQLKRLESDDKKKYKSKIKEIDSLIESVSTGEGAKQYQKDLPYKKYEKLLETILKDLDKAQNQLLKDLHKLTKHVSEDPEDPQTKMLCSFALQLDPNNKKFRKFLNQDKIFPFGWMSKEDAKKIKKKIYPVNGSWMSLKDIKNESEKHSKWHNAWEIRSEHFVFKSNLDFDTIMERIEAVENYYTVFYEEFGIEAGLPQASDIVVLYFSNNDEFMEHGKEGCHEKISKQTAGYASSRCPHMDFKHLEIDKNNTGAIHYFFTRDDYSTLFHELTHHLIREGVKLVGNSGQNPHYHVVEGLATYFEPAFKGQRVPAKVDAAKILAMGGYMPLDEFFQMDQDTMYQEDKMLDHYNQACGVTHFFMNADKKKYRRAFIRYALIVSAGAATESTFEDIFLMKPSEFEKDWKKYLKKLKIHPLYVDSPAG